MDNYPINNSQDALLFEINYYITYIYLYLKKKILKNIPTFCGFIPIVGSAHALDSFPVIIKSAMMAVGRPQQPQ